MQILFVHQNFPGQFRYSAAALAADTSNRVVALCINEPAYPTPGILIARYGVKRGPVKDIHPLLHDIQSKVLRGEACAAAAIDLKRKGFIPDVIVVHPGWGEQLFLRDVFPAARILSFMEFFYAAEGRDTNFDREFANDGLAVRARTRMKNANH
ncbi:MAG: glycosyl transferase family 1, partial [Beijerinckiaceae bacterium]